MTSPSPLPFTGLRGHLLAAMLQLPVVRHHRVQLGFVEAPAEYDAFIAQERKSWAQIVKAAGLSLE